MRFPRVRLPRIAEGSICCRETARPVISTKKLERTGRDMILPRLLPLPLPLLLLHLHRPRPCLRLPHRRSRPRTSPHLRHLPRHLFVSCRPHHLLVPRPCLCLYRATRVLLGSVSAAALDSNPNLL